MTRSVFLSSPHQAGERVSRIVPGRHQMAELAEQPFKPTATVTVGNYWLSRSTCQRDSACGVSRRMLGPQTTHAFVPSCASMTKRMAVSWMTRSIAAVKKIRDARVPTRLPLYERSIELCYVPAELRQERR